MAAMNALLHGFGHSPIGGATSSAAARTAGGKAPFDFILEDPPFSGAAQSPKRSLCVVKGEKYVLSLTVTLRRGRSGGSPASSCPTASTSATPTRTSK